MIKNFDPDMIISILLIKLTCLEKILQSKGLITEEEYNLETRKVTEQFMKIIFKSSNKSQEEIDIIMKSILNTTKN